MRADQPDYYKTCVYDSDTVTPNKLKERLGRGVYLRKSFGGLSRIEFFFFLVESRHKASATSTAGTHTGGVQ